MALETCKPEALAERFDASIDKEDHGFAFEGAAMALALLDQITPWNRNRWRSLLDGAGQRHRYMVHVGAGWALARFSWNFKRAFPRYDPLLRWLVVEGYGFHEGFFHGDRCVRAKRRPPRLSGYARRAFDQGLGRCLWFIEGADGPRISATIKHLGIERAADLWSGIGLACAYAGGLEADQIEALRVAAEDYAPHLAQGAAFGAKARQRALIPTAHTEQACRILCRMSAKEAAQVTDTLLADLPPDDAVPSFEAWRQRIRIHLTRKNPRM